MFSDRELVHLRTNFINFDRIAAAVEKSANNQLPKYPPYDLVKTESGFELSLAVAGFSEEDISIRVEDGKLVVEATKSETETSDEAFLHRGIGRRAFTREWELNDNLEVATAKLENGILTIAIQQELPNVKNIDIITGSTSRLLTEDRNERQSD